MLPARIQDVEMPYALDELDLGIVAEPIGVRPRDLIVVPAMHEEGRPGDRRHLGRSAPLE